VIAHALALILPLVAGVVPFALLPGEIKRTSLSSPAAPAPPVGETEAGVTFRPD
jgi:hypothetical protein